MISLEEIGITEIST